VTTSCTSSSEPPAPRRWARLPWAGLLALLALVAIDRAIFGFWQPWEWLGPDDPNSAAGSRLELAQLREQPPERPRVAVVGTSRVIDGFNKPLAEKLLPGAAIAKLAHPRFEPFALRALVPDLLAADVDAVVLIASEQDTHRPLRLEPVPGSSTASLGAVWELLRVTDWSFAVDNRLALYRLVASSALGLYRYLPELRQRGLEERRSFALEQRHVPGREPDDPFRPIALWGADRNEVPEAALRSTWDLFPPLSDAWNGRIQAGTVQEITVGPHVAVQQALFRSAVHELRQAGVEVIVVQGAMHPAADDLYDVDTRRAFLDFAASLEAQEGIHFVPRERVGLLAESDFYDLFHTNARGARTITHAMVEALRGTGIPWPRERVEPNGAPGA
jgi:hypothetical protein